MATNPWAMIVIWACLRTKRRLLGEEKDRMNQELERLLSDFYVKKEKKQTD